MKAGVKLLMPRYDGILLRPRKRTPRTNHCPKYINNSFKPTPHVKQRSNRGVVIQENIRCLKSISNISPSFANTMTTKLNNAKQSTTSAKNQTPRRKRTTTEPKCISKSSLRSPRPDKSSKRNIITIEGFIKQRGIPTGHKLKPLIIYLPNPLNLSRL